MTENYTYYADFEGEPEYAFCLHKHNLTVEKIHIWDGYFSDIIDTVQPTENGWTSLSEYYHLCIDFDSDNWNVPDIPSALRQLENIDTLKIKFPESHEVLETLIELFRKALESNSEIFIEYS